MPGENPFEDELARRSSNPFAAEIEKRNIPSANFAFRDRFSRTIINNAMAVPDASGEILADAGNAAEALIGKFGRFGLNNLRSLVGMERKPNPSLGERYSAAAERESFGQHLLRGIPRTTTEEIDAAVESVPALWPGGESFGTAYDRNRFANLLQESEMRSAHPVASTAGDIGGDIATLFLGRRSTGLDKTIQRLETRLSGRAGTELAQNLADDLRKVVKGPAWQRMARGSLRSLEAGVEAAALDVLKDPNADPMDTAALAAGGQLVGSGMLSGAQGLLSGGPMSAGVKITVAAASTWGLLQLLKSATPGGEDRILESIETGYDKVALMLGLGVGAAAVGATRYGRGNTALADQTRTLLDNIGTVHRGTQLSVLTDWTEGGPEKKAAIETVLMELSKDPTYSGSNDEERDLVRKLRAGAGLVRYRSGGGF